MKPLPNQLDLFGPRATAREQYEIPLNPSVPDAEKPRLRQQHAAILAALRDGPKTNLELQAIAHRFGARLEELKRAGHGWTKRYVRPGVYLYALEARP